jgi:glutaconate CoA-transferase subunit B
MANATRRETQIIEASRHLADFDPVILGAGVPFAIATFAQKTHAPNASFIIDSGIIDPLLSAAPASVGDPAIRVALSMGSMHDVFLSLLQGGRIRTGLLSAAQVDRFGNINSSYVESPGGARRRLPGAGGANAIASFCRRLIIVVPHERRRFPARCDYVSSPGYVDGPGGRLRAGLASEPEEILVVTDLCVMRATPDVGTLCVTRLMPDTDMTEVRRETGFALEVIGKPEQIVPPTSDQLVMLRQEVDPGHLYIGNACNQGHRAGHSHEDGGQTHE